MCETIREFSASADAIVFKSDIARSEIKIIGYGGHVQKTSKMDAFTVRELKDVLYELKFMKPDKKVRIRDTIIDFNGEECHVWECIKHVQRILDHRSKYNME